MDGRFDKVPNIPTGGKVNGQPIVSLTVLSIHFMGGGIIDHDKKFLPSCNMWGSEKLPAPFNSKINQPV